MTKSTTIIIRRLRKVEIFILALLIFGYTGLSFAQSRKVDTNALVQEETDSAGQAGFLSGRKVDITALVRETQKMSQSADEVTVIWWIPEEYWQVSFEHEPNMTAAQAERFIKPLRPYMVIVAIDGKMGPFGGVTYKPRATIQNSIQIVDREGTHYRPLSDEKIDIDVKNFLLMMKPVFVNMLGPLGQNMHFFLFPSLSKKGKKIVDAKNEGTFSVKLDKREFKWRLPLGSLIPPKVCPVDGEKMSGAWKFCPWHGVELK